MRQAFKDIWTRRTEVLANTMIESRSIPAHLGSHRSETRYTSAPW